MLRQWSSPRAIESGDDSLKRADGSIDSLAANGAKIVGVEKGPDLFSVNRSDTFCAFLTIYSIINAGQNAWLITSVTV